MPPTALFNKEVESADYLDKHEPLIHQQWNGGLPQYRTDPTAEIVEFINSTAGDLGPEKLGLAILIGMSSGGRNTATVADQIKGRRLFPYVAAIDAAFDDKWSAHLWGSWLGSRGKDRHVARCRLVVLRIGHDEAANFVQLAVGRWVDQVARRLGVRICRVQHPPIAGKVGRDHRGGICRERHVDHGLTRVLAVGRDHEPEAVRAVDASAAIEDKAAAEHIDGVAAGLQVHAPAGIPARVGAVHHHVGHHAALIREDDPLTRQSLLFRL